MNRLSLAIGASLLFHTAVFLGIPSDRSNVALQDERSQTAGNPVPQLSIALAMQQPTPKLEKTKVEKVIVKKPEPPRKIVKQTPKPVVQKRPVVKKIPIVKKTPKATPTKTTSLAKNPTPTVAKTVSTKKGNSVRKVSAADYARNTPIKYPRLARRRNQTGEVMLLVDISEEGKAIKVEIKKSSGHRLLDRAATSGVSRWNFTPARSGNLKVASRVLVPINFKLLN